MASSSGNSDSQHSLSCCRLHQEYTLLHLLGEGSYAKVLLCQKNEDDEMFAVKIIPLDDTREGKERREVKAHRTLSGHPNIVRFYQSWEGTRETTCIEDDLDDSEYTAESASDSLIVTTVQDGPADPINILHCHNTIKDQCRNFDLSGEQVHSISKRKAWKYFKELITALQYIHSQGFIHRDITTGNLFLSSEGRLVVGDFGFAIEVEYADDFYHGYNTRLCSAKVGTALYAAPEVMSPEPQEVGCLADIYSAGIVLIDLLDPFTLSMERSCVLQGINDGYFPDTLLPLEASYIKRLVSMDAMNRPSAQTLLDQFDEDTAGIRATYPVEAMDEDTSDDSD